MNTKDLNIVSETRGLAVVVSDESGKGTFWAMLFCVAAVSGYMKYGHAWMIQNLPPIHHTLIVLTLAVVTIFTLGCALHMVFIGDRSARELRRDLKKQIEEIQHFAAEAVNRITELENRSMTKAGVIRPYGINCLSNARRITLALKRRTDQVGALLATKDRLDLIDAHELLTSNLDIRENAVDSLIGSDPIPALPPEEWLTTVEQLCAEVEQELEKLAA